MMKTRIRPPGIDDAQTFVMRYPPAVGVLGGLLVALGVAAVGASALGADAVLADALGAWAPGQRRWIAVAGAALALGGGAVVLSVLRTRVEVRGGGMTVHTWTRRKPLAMWWDEADSSSFSMLTGLLTMRLRDGRAVRVSAFLRGALALAGTLGQNLRARGTKKALRRLRLHARLRGVR